MAQEYDGGAGFDGDEWDKQQEELALRAKEKKARETTDCRTEEGITVGLIDSLITISRVVKQRIVMLNDTPAVQEAIKDLKGDADLNFILKCNDHVDNQNSKN